MHWAEPWRLIGRRSAEIAHPVTAGTSRSAVADGRVRPPVERGMPDVIDDLAPDVASLCDVLIADRRSR